MESLTFNIVSLANIIGTLYNSKYKENMPLLEGEFDYEAVVSEECLVDRVSHYVCDFIFSAKFYVGWYPHG